jgi:hypothetical protein
VRESRLFELECGVGVETLHAAALWPRLRRELATCGYVEHIRER